MDPSGLVVIAAVAAAVVVVPRAVLRSVGTAGDVVAQLFVPPDRSFGWPHGVQEIDAPWRWTDAAGSSRPRTEAATSGSERDTSDLDIVQADIVELDIAAVEHSGSGLIVPVR